MSDEIVLESVLDKIQDFCDRYSMTQYLVRNIDVNIITGLKKLLSSVNSKTELSEKDKESKCYSAACQAILITNLPEIAERTDNETNTMRAFHEIDLEIFDILKNEIPINYINSESEELPILYLPPIII